MAKTQSSPFRSAFAALGLVALAALAGCTTSALDIEPDTTISPKLAREIRAKGFREQDPVLIRIFKAESELEVWKKKPSGQYALFKTYPICRWSGKLGPKKKIGDRQAPEGFYDVSLGQLNPKSQFYLSFNLGYPNRLESALGYTGEALMVHGACSSSGCFALTDQQMAEIYPLVKAALGAGQPSFQVQSYPFRMTSESMARHAGDPNMEFWRAIKVGYDLFQTTRREPAVGACSGRYVFNQPAESLPANPLAPCLNEPALASAPLSMPTASTASTAYAYQDGGMHKSFRELLTRYGEKRLAARISLRKYPISRPGAALADPYQPTGD